jgi:hypothetical protein
MTRESAKSTTPVPMVSMGYVILDGKDALRLAMTSENEEPFKVTEVLVIPRQNVIKIRKI